MQTVPEQLLQDFKIVSSVVSKGQKYFLASENVKCGTEIYVWNN